MWFSQKNEVNFFYVEFRKMLNEEKEDYLNYIKKEERSIVENVFKKQMDNFFAAFEFVRHERSIILILSVTNPDISKQSRFMNHGIYRVKQMLQKNCMDKEHLTNMSLYNYQFGIFYLLNANLNRGPKVLKQQKTRLTNNMIRTIY